VYDVDLQAGDLAGNSQLAEDAETVCLQESIPGDLNGDGYVDQADLGILLADWGRTGGECPGDCDDNRDTDRSDLGILLAHWGEGCPYTRRAGRAARPATPQRTPARQRYLAKLRGHERCRAVTGRPDSPTREVHADWCAFAVEWVIRIACWPKPR